MDTLTKPQKSKRKISFREFVAGKQLKRTFLAGFKKYAKVEFMTEEEWTKTLSDYQNR